MNETPIEAFEQMMPWIDSFFKEFNRLFPSNHAFEIHPKGWKHIYTGLGNHLLVADEIYDNFANEEMASLIETRRQSEIYMRWKERACVVLGSEI